jgi:hypothetical protein
MDMDLLALIERILIASENGGEQELSLPIPVIRLLVDASKLAPKVHGRPKTLGRAKIRETLVRLRQQRRKAELIADGMKHEAAADQAAEEAAKALQGRNLAATTLKRRAQRSGK